MSASKKMPLWKKIALALLSVSMVFIGIGHFVDPEPFVRIVPSWLPAPLWLVWISGVFEILGGIGVAIPKTRKWAAWGLIALFVAVFPANINMAVNEIQLSPDDAIPVWAMWARLPFQLVFIAWAWIFTRDKKESTDGQASGAEAS